MGKRSNNEQGGARGDASAYNVFVCKTITLNRGEATTRFATPQGGDDHNGRLLFEFKNDTKMSKLHRQDKTLMIHFV